jgi:hypothetical protein
MYRKNTSLTDISIKEGCLISNRFPCTKYYYQNNTEYRNVLREIFCMDIPEILTQLRSKYPDFDGFDEETQDELLFDEKSIEHGMTEILKETIHCHEIKQLYVLAAGVMLSENPETGLAVLMSYDYLSPFFNILFIFFTEGKENISKCDDYSKLQRIFTTK